MKTAFSHLSAQLQHTSVRSWAYRLLVPVFILALVLGCGKKSDPDPFIVGSWSLVRSVFTGFVAPFTSYNNTTLTGANLDPETLVFKNDKTLTDTYVDANGKTQTATGTWELAGNTVTIKIGTSSIALTYSESTKELSTALYDVSASLTNPTTSKAETVLFKEQDFYTKQ